MVPRSRRFALAAGFAALGLSPALDACAREPESLEQHNLRIFDAAWRVVERNYYDREARRTELDAIASRTRPLAAKAANDVDLYLNVLRSGFGTLGESHFDAVPPQPAPRPQTSAHPAAPLFTPSGDPPRKGLGFTFTMNANDFVVVGVDKGSPLERADVGPGDRILALSMGPAGSASRFEGRFERPDGTLADLSYLWTASRPPPFAATPLPSGRLLLRFDHYDDAALAWLREQLKRVPAKGVVLDLRANNGGDTRANQHLLGALLGDSVPIGIWLAGRRRVEKTKGSQLYAGALAILIGPMSASAAEVTADALRRHRRAVLVGERTAGAVLVARRFDLPGGGAVQVPIAGFLDLDGKPLEGVGVAPDRPARQTLAAIRADKDLALAAAEAALDAARSPQAT